MHMRIVPVISAVCFAWNHKLCNVNRKARDCRGLFQSTSDDESYSEKLRQKKLHDDRIRKRRHRNLELWGYESAYSSTYEQKLPPVCPSTFDELAEDAYHAIRGTILGLQRPDPNRVVNAMHRSVLDHRPTHPFYASSQNLDDEYVNSSSGKTRGKATAPIARMGIEIDGAAYLLSSDEMPEERSTDEGRALRILSLKIAGRLASLHEDEQEVVTPVAVYYNSMQQTLLASIELRRLKQASDVSFSDSLDQIEILCLGQDSLPKNMLRKKNKSAQNGIVLVVKPTDYNYDSPIAFDSPDYRRRTYRPTIHANVVEHLQSLLLQATASSVPAVVISPRLSELPPLQQYSSDYSHKTGPSGFEQSGYQKSATFGGKEPPVGPTSWLLRDLIPPVYVWVGCSLDLLKGTEIAGRKRRARPSRESLVARHGNEIGDINFYHFYSRVALMQSSMDSGHMYHLFAVRETAEIFPDTLVWESSSEFMGSLKSSLGRPTSDVMRDVMEEWIES